MSAVPSPETGEPADQAVTMSLLRCGSCDRRWLAAGDLRPDGPTPCPYCDGEAGVLGVHR